MVQSRGKKLRYHQFLRHIPVSEMLKYMCVGGKVYLREDGIQWELIKMETPLATNMLPSHHPSEPPTLNPHLSSALEIHSYVWEAPLPWGWVRFVFSVTQSRVIRVLHVIHEIMALSWDQAMSWKPPQCQYKSLKFLKNRIRNFLWVTLNLMELLLPFEGVRKSLLGDSQGFLNALSDLAHL